MFERFENVREQLLRAGVAPRHAKRYLRELNDHFDDLVREHTETGMDKLPPFSPPTGYVPNGIKGSR